MEEPREVVIPQQSPVRVISVREEPEDDPFIKRIREWDARMDKAYAEELSKETRPAAVIISLGLV